VPRSCAFGEACGKLAHFSILYPDGSVGHYCAPHYDKMVEQIRDASHDNEFYLNLIKDNRL
jgi:hypothetical protein